MKKLLFAPLFRRIIIYKKMRSLLIFLVNAFFMIVVCIGCNNQNNTKNADSRTDEIINSSGESAEKQYEKGARLLAKNDCFTCHSIDKKIVGPAYVDIAAKYHNDQKYADYLSISVVKGSKGIYGDQVMTPHANVPYDDIREMLKYILSLKKK